MTEIETKLVSIQEKLDKIEVRLDSLIKYLDENFKEERIHTFQNDGEIMFRYKNKNK